MTLDVQSPENSAAESDSVSMNGAAPLVNGTPIDNLEARIEAELNHRRNTMRARAAYGDELYQKGRAVVAGYKKLDGKNIPSTARAALTALKELLDSIDAAAAS